MNRLRRYLFSRYTKPASTRLARAGSFKPKFDSLEDRVVPDAMPAFAIGAGIGQRPEIRTFTEDGTPVLTITAFDASFRGGVRVAVGDLNNDGTPDVVAVPGPGGPPEVRVFDGKNGRVLHSITAYSPAFTGGLYVALGDVNGDGRVDVVTGPDAGGGPHVRAFDGIDGQEIANFFAYDLDFRGGVRVAVGDLDGDGRAEVIAAAGPGGGPHVRAFDVTDGSVVANYFSYAADFRGGVFVSAADFQGTGQASIITGPDAGGGPHVRVFDGTGTATANFMAADPSERTGTRLGTVKTEGGGIDLLTATSAGLLGRYEGTTFEPVKESETAVGSGAFVGTLGVPANVVSIQIAAPRTGVPNIDDCANNPGSIIFPGGSPAQRVAEPPIGEFPIRYFDGVPFITGYDLESEGYGIGWGQTRSWTSDPGYTTRTTYGNSWATAQQPYLVEGDEEAIIVVLNGYVAIQFDSVVGGYATAHYSQLDFVHDTGNDEFVLTDAGGGVIRFSDFSTSYPVARRGEFSSQTDPTGTATAVTSRNTDGQQTEVQRSYTVGGTTTIESYLYVYLTSGSNAGKVESVTLRRKVGAGSYSTVRSIEYAYYGSSDSNGTLGDLKTAVVKDASGNPIDTSYYRYYTSDTSIGFTGGLKYVFNGQAFARLAADVADPFAASDSTVAPYLNHYFEYNADRRVTKEIASGAGCSVCSGGQGTYLFAYTTSGNSAGYGNWARKTVVTLPDGNTDTVYTNAYSQVMLKVFTDTTTDDEWMTFNRYGGFGQLEMVAEPSAVSGFDDDYADLVHYVSGNAEFLRDDAGLIMTFAYATSTTATTSVAGNANGYISSTNLLHGETATAVPQSATTYILRAVGDIVRVFPAAETAYRNDNGTGGQTSTTTYTWVSGTFQPANVTTTLPTVTTAQNGPNSATSFVTVLDAYGRPVWGKDQAGFITYMSYDTDTGSVIKQIVDVDTAQTGTFANLPSGWSTPGGGGLHLTTTMEVDKLGRTTKMTAPNGRVDYTVFDDDSFEVRYYPGWNTSTNAPTGPTTVYRADRARGYTETLTMSAAPNYSSGRPTGTESIGSLQSLSRNYRNEAGQVVHQDEYFNLSGVTYSTSANIGTLNTNYYRTEIKYSTRGWFEKTASPLGTIYRNVFDGLGRVVSEWVGTDDTPTSGFWSPTNTAGTNLTKIREYEYDGGGIGDSNVTKQTSIPGSGATNRVTQTYFDWRNRPMAVKVGVDTSESSGVNRPIYYTDYDNLNQVTKSRTYDGDAESVTTTSGVPNAPTASKLRAQSTNSYDELGRVYLSEIYFVDPNNGSLTTNTNTLKSNTWYDARGQVIKTSSPGGLVQKMAYDGAGRVTTSYASDGGGDSGYSDADDVTGDKVLEQSEPAYDTSGNVLSQTIRQRNHDETGTGVLGTASTGNKARVSYVAYYYDVGDRTTAVADYGTYGASSWTRAGSVPSRSDTILVTSFDYDSAGRQWKVTDPKAIVSWTEYDALGRTLKTIEHYVDGTVGDDNDKTTEYTYNAAGMTTLIAKLTGGGQTTEWIYGVTTGGGSTFNSNDVSVETRWPDPSTGASSSGQKDLITINALGQTLTSTDRNGTVHTLGYDTLGRVITDTVTTLGTNIDGAIRRVATVYHISGALEAITNYDATSGGNVVNQVTRNYTGLWQLARDNQEHNGSVTGSTLYASYAYTEMASGANHSRINYMQYPNFRQILPTYGTGGSLDDTISRLSALKESSTTLESYDYLGLGTVVKRGHAQSGVDLTYIKASGEGNGDAGDQYTGLDRFGRVVDQRWRTSSVEKDRYQYGYDRNGNRLYRDNLVNTALGELYAYDNLNQLSSFDRGTLNGSKNGLTGAASRSQDWDYEALGNFDSVTTDGGSAVTRTHNKQNEITAVSGSTSPVFDANGNMTTDETGKQYVYDAWNRLVTVKNSGGTTIASYEYDGLTRRIQETASSVTTDLYYSDQWQVIEERVSGTSTKSYVWSAVYVDAMVARDRDTDANGSLDERLYAMHDANFNVTGLVNTSGTVVERNTYDAFGTVTVRDGSWSVTTTAYVWQYFHQGGRLSGQSGLYAFRYREYSPTLARWVTMDPIQYQSYENNLYISYSNNAIVNTDYAGLQKGQGRSPPPYQRNPIPRTIGNQRCYDEYGPGGFYSNPFGTRPIIPERPPIRIPPPITSTPIPTWPYLPQRRGPIAGSPFPSPYPSPYPEYPPHFVGPRPRVRYLNQTCSNTTLDRLQNAKDTACNKGFHGYNYADLNSSSKREKIPCSDIQKRMSDILDCLLARADVINVCFGGDTDMTHQKIMDDLFDQLRLLHILAERNCAPGHPMANK